MEGGLTRAMAQNAGSGTLDWAHLRVAGVGIDDVTLKQER